MCRLVEVKNQCFFGRVVASWQHTDVYERLSYEKSQPDRELLVKPSNVYVTDMLHAMYFGHIICNSEYCMVHF